MKKRLFEAYGVEIEYMIVDAVTLDVRPVADRLIHAGDSRKNDVTHGRYKWSNELVAHVIEIKTNGPVVSLEGLAAGFQAQVDTINRDLSALGCRLLPTGMHPWMNPGTETTLWPHDDKEIYETFDRVFGCKGHGWSNLQSTHLNLAFDGEEEFRRLHSAIRLVLPLIPALASSSPLADGAYSDCLNQRLVAYRKNCARFPSISARLVPAVIRSEAEYEAEIYAKIARDLESVQADDVLEPVWVNARGAIARFDRGSIEIRLIDTQECPAADMAIHHFIVQLLQALVAEKHAPLAAQESLDTELLSDLLQATITSAGKAPAPDAFAQIFGQSGVTVRELLRRINAGQESTPAMEVILREGCLAERIQQSVGEASRDSLRKTFGRLADCLQRGELFHA